MDKFSKAKGLLEPFYKNNIKINYSPPNGYRSRCEFGYRDSHYTMFDTNGNRIYLDSFEIARPSIFNLMPLMLNEINRCILLNKKLFQVNFRTNNQDKIMASLVYHKQLDREIKEKALKIANKLEIIIILRAKKEFYSTHEELLIDRLEEFNINLFQTDQSFYQPNHFHMPEMIKKVISFIDKPQDLLELYCGSGTFTIPLSKYFANIFATESNRQSIRCLNKSIQESNIINIEHARLSAEEVSEAFNGRIFRRMAETNIADYNFSHILVDPPRSGIGKEVAEVAQLFNNIIYVSCNYETFTSDMLLLKNHKINHIEIYDQFPNTKHLEIVSLLSKI